jgi:hypothetical protein
MATTNIGDPAVKVIRKEVELEGKQITGTESVR